MSTTSKFQFPRIMPLHVVARELLMINTREACKMAREGRILGAFKLGDRWFVSLPKMIVGMKLAPNFERLVP